METFAVLHRDRVPAMKKKQIKGASLHFPSVPLAQANRRASKHYKIVRDILSDVARLDEFSAIKINLAEIGKNKAELRAAIHRAAKRQKVPLATTSDEKHLYIFRSSSNSGNKPQGLQD
jgi:hypothetical protein